MTLGGPALTVGGFRRPAKDGTAPAGADAPGACRREPPGPPESWGPYLNTSDDPGRRRRGCRRRGGSNGRANAGRADAATPTSWCASDAGGSSPSKSSLSVFAVTHPHRLAINPSLGNQDLQSPSCRSQSPARIVVAPSHRPISHTQLHLPVTGRFSPDSDNPVISLTWSTCAADGRCSSSRKVRLRLRCASCRGRLALRARGRPARFCGTACRSAAYRRRRQRLAEDAPRWRGPRGRLTLRNARTWRARLAALMRRRARQRAASATKSANPLQARAQYRRVRGHPRCGAPRIEAVRRRPLAVGDVR